MSLSQKHSGKVLVPWFNIAEWTSVYNLIYSETGKDWQRALTILRIWKHRTPLLSAGVEGTLIILEALLVNTNQLSSYESSHIFSTSLVRFLNLCAANSDKQGTFYKTAIKNELPKWLISIRHDIAHSHKIPSQSMLELSLKFCLEWLKGKYWDVQYDNMSDFVVNELENSVVEDAVYVYSHWEDHQGQDKELVRCIKKFVRINQQQISSKKIMESVNGALREEMKVNKKKSIDKICTLLIDDLTILSSECEMDESGTKKIPLLLLNKWNSLINVIHETESLPDFISTLFNFTTDERHDFSHREIASFWIKEIFSGLINKEDKSEDQSGLVFKSKNDCMKIKPFATQVLERLSPFTLNFLEEVLKYNNAPPQFIEDSVCLVSAFNTHTDYGSDRIFTIDDLEIDAEDSSDVILNNDTATQPKSRWALIEDTSPFINLPLGVLPHQDRNMNPLLVT